MPPRKPLPVVPVPPIAAAYKAEAARAVPDPSKPKQSAGLAKSAVGARGRATKIRTEGKHEYDVERAKAQHYTDAAKMLREKATSIRKALAAKKKVGKEAAKTAKGPKAVKAVAGSTEEGEYARRG